MYKVCSICGSEEIIPNVRVRDMARGAGELHIYIDTHPHALIFKDPVLSKVKAEVCASCGHVEFFADAPRSLWQAHIERQSDLGNE